MKAESEDPGVIFRASSDNQVDKVRYAPPASSPPKRVWINRHQHFEGVEPEVWAFTIGGCRPADKSLKDRKGRTLSGDGIEHYGKIIAALGETRRLMSNG